jgi:hypothetical protein
MKKILFSTAFMLTAILSFSQPKIQFNQTTYDFGTIREEGGKVTGRFEFTNIGDSALVLTNVKPGCGCTAANYTKTPVAPGQTGFIDATYDPYNRPGSFNKNIRVTTNEPQFRDASAAPQMLFIKGTVTKRPPTEFELAGYKIGSGMMRIKENSKRVELKNTQSQVDTFLLKNFWNKGVTVQYQELPAYFTEVHRSFVNELAPGEEGIIILKYDASKRNAWGNVRDNIILLTNDSLEPKKVINYSVMITEDFSKLTEKQRKNAPIFTTDLMEVDFGNVVKNQTQTKEVVIKNTGKSPLIIRQLQPSTTALTATMDKMTIAPNESVTLKMVFRANNRNGKQAGTVDIFTNDPANPQISIKFSSEITN